MLREERLWHITQKLLQNRVVRVGELADEFGLTAATVRTDLTELENRGLARRTHGGAILVETLAARETHTAEAISIEETRLAERFDVQRAEKKAIGRAAAALIEDEETIAIDGGTTTYQVARNLAEKRHLTIITCVLNDVWQELVTRADLQIFFTGGFLRAESLSMVGEVAEAALRSFWASKAILGIDGISCERGFTVLNFLEASVKKRMIEASQELIFVADHTKFGKVAPIPVAHVDRKCTVITDWRAPEQYVTRLRECGVNVIVAPGASAQGVGGERLAERLAERPAEEAAGQNGSAAETPVVRK
jgi:DeoR/GlpR family transcriptional regulator of sugar metabolism